MHVTGEMAYRVWLSSIENMGSKHTDALLSVFGSAEAVWREADAGNTAFLGESLSKHLMAAREQKRLSALLERVERCGANIVQRGDESYPDWLEAIVDPPALLYTLGRGELLEGEHHLSVVGARYCSRYGQDAAVSLSSDLAALGVCIVSGMARGIDSCAHRGALQARGDTLAVLGCGVDVVYPKENGKLYEEICENGLIVSEYAPGADPLPHHFPARNRIISGLSQGLILVEAAERSGSMITVDFAMEQGREVFAVPGNITSRTSFWPNRLIRDGVHPALDAQDILETMRWQVQTLPAAAEKKSEMTVTLDVFEQRVVEALSRGECTLEELENETKMEMASLNMALTMLEVRGIVETLPGRVVALKKF